VPLAAPRPVWTRPAAGVARLSRSATLRTSALAGVLGLAFTLANLLLARVLPVPEYAVVALALAIVTLGYTLGPLGLDRIVVRRNLPATPALLRHGMRNVALVTAVVAPLALLVYGLSPLEVGLLVPSIFAGGAAYLGASRFHSEGRFLTGTFVSQGGNVALLAAAVAVALAGAGGVRLVLALFAGGLSGLALAGWTVLLRRGERDGGATIGWSEELAVAGITGVLVLYAVLDRLLIPLFLTPADLAHFAVLASMVVAPFRLLQMGVQRTLMPRLRDAPGPAARRRVLSGELATVGGVALAAAAGLWFVVPAIERVVLAGKYETSPALLLVTILSGLARVLAGFGTSAMNALAGVGRLSVGSLTGWLSLLVAVAAAWIGSRWGLPGLVAGTAAAAVLHGVSALALVRSRLREA
jgi:O-antigen/teichoic acid export membrane protein